MWNTNKLLKILPFEELSKEDRAKVSEFFSY